MAFVDLPDGRETWDSIRRGEGGNESGEGQGEEEG
jgi:hypothetical protein